MPITFRSSRIVYYGPHSCENCGATICKMGFEWGGNAFTYPEGPIYPNTEWHAHVCDPEAVKRHSDFKGSAVSSLSPHSHPVSHKYHSSFHDDCLECNAGLPTQNL